MIISVETNYPRRVTIAGSAGPTLQMADDDGAKPYRVDVGIEAARELACNLTRRHFGLHLFIAAGSFGPLKRRWKTFCG